jgi:hypothetical protein
MDVRMAVSNAPPVSPAQRKGFGGMLLMIVEQVMAVHAGVEHGCPAGADPRPEPLLPDWHLPLPVGCRVVMRVMQMPHHCPCLTASQWCEI